MWYMHNNDKSGQTLDISPKLYKNQKVHGKMIKIINQKIKTTRYYFTSTTKMHIS